MASGASSSATGSTSRYRASNELQKESTPLWAYVTIVDRSRAGENLVVGGGNRYWKCNYCNNEYNGSYSRVKWHLLKVSGKGIAVCSKVDSKCLIEMKTMQDMANNLLKPKQVPLPPPALGLSPLNPNESIVVESPYNQGKRRAVSGLEKAFNNGARAKLCGEIARMFYSAGLSFNLARNPYYISSFQYVANNVIAGFKPPGYNALRGPLLQKERANVERLLEPIKGTWSEKGVSIVTDGWTDAQRRPLINFMAISDGGPIFLKAIDGSKEYKDKYYIANLMKQVVEEVKPQNVVQIITDNAPVCKVAGKLVEAEYPHIFWTPCVVHTLNLALKNICAANNTEANEVVFEECRWITQVRDDAICIRTFIMNHSMRLAIFNEFVPLKLLAIAETQFASTVVMLKRPKLIKRPLQTMVISEEWSTYRDDDVGKANMVKEFILDDFWWDKIDYIISFTKPIYDMLRFCDTNKSTLHMVYDMWDSMVEEVKASIYKHENKEPYEYSKFYEVVYGIIIDRWTKSCSLHCLAHSLNSRYYTPQWLEGVPNRISPHKDEEISTERTKYFGMYFREPMERKMILREFSKFFGASEAYSLFDSLQDRWILEPKK